MSVSVSENKSVAVEVDLEQRVTRTLLRLGPDPKPRGKARVFATTFPRTVQLCARLARQAAREQRPRRKPTRQWPRTTEWPIWSRPSCTRWSLKTQTMTAKLPPELAPERIPSRCKTFGGTGIYIFIICLLPRSSYASFTALLYASFTCFPAAFPLYIIFSILIHPSIHQQSTYIFCFASQQEVQMVLLPWSPDPGLAKGTFGSENAMQCVRCLL